MRILQRPGRLAVELCPQSLSKPLSPTLERITRGIEIIIQRLEFNNQMAPLRVLSQMNLSRRPLELFHLGSQN